MPVKVDEDTVMKAISPGDRVDVMVFLRRNGQEIPETGAFTILKNVRVFAVNTNTERATRRQGRNGQLPHRLAAREARSRPRAGGGRPDGQDHAHAPPPRRKRRADRRRSHAAGRTSWRAARSRAANRRAAAAPRPRRRFLGLRPGLGQCADNARPSRRRPTPIWTMDILAPTERKQFEWTDLKQTADRKSSLQHARTSPCRHTPAPAARRRPATARIRRLGRSQPSERRRRPARRPDKDTSSKRIL